MSGDVIEVLDVPFTDPRYQKKTTVLVCDAFPYKRKWYIVFLQFLFPQGDEINALGDSWMFLVWASDASPFLSNSMSSRFPIAVLPASRYVTNEAGVNLTLESACVQITRSFNLLSNRGVKVRNSASLNSQTVSWPVCFLFWVY